MKLANTLYALIIFLFTACSAQASPMWSYAWSDIAFTAESGTHVEASVDKKGNLTKLAIVKNGKRFLAPDTLLKRVTGAWIHNITIFEEPKYA